MSPSAAVADAAAVVVVVVVVVVVFFVLSSSGMSDHGESVIGLVCLAYAGRSVAGRLYTRSSAALWWRMVW